MRRLITLLTDFGTADGYVGQMKGVLFSLAPDADVVDLTHDIPPQDVDAARLALAHLWRRFPQGSVHLVVVDPGVGSARDGLAVASDGRFLVGPDNGVLSPALLVAGARVVSLPLSPTAAPTFHGRDVFAPAAAALARGESFDGLGVEAQQPIIRRTPEAMRRPDGGIDGEVIAIDRFGNAITNLIALRGGAVEHAGRRIPIQRTYAEVPIGTPVAIVGSTGFVEIAIRNGDAAATLALIRGSRVTLRS
jgi:S-adenosyl-L-methionine hydrolase (adenosine-forming)